MSTNGRSSTADSAHLPRIVGHEAHEASFRRLAEEKALRHAYLFYGDEGIGKFRFAIGLAHFLEYGVWECGEEALRADALVVSVSENGTTIGIDEVRTLRAFLSTTPLAAPYRIAIIRDAERLSHEAESALLKIMEEPPPHTLIIVVARDPNVLAPPLASRMAKIYFARFSRAALADFLRHNFKMSPRQAALLAGRSFGRPGYALRLAATKNARKEEDGVDLPRKLERLIVARWEIGVRAESRRLAFLLDRFEAASRFNLNPRLQEKAVAHALGA